jgi:hypothetical protein
MTALQVLRLFQSAPGSKTGGNAFIEEPPLGRTDAPLAAEAVSSNEKATSAFGYPSECDLQRWLDLSA